MEPLSWNQGLAHLGSLSLGGYSLCASPVSGTGIQVISGREQQAQSNPPYDLGNLPVGQRYISRLYINSYI